MVAVFKRGASVGNGSWAVVGGWFESLIVWNIEAGSTVVKDAIFIMTGLVFFCVHKSSRVVHQFSQGLEIGISRGVRGARRLWTGSFECRGIWQGRCNCPSETKKSQHHKNEHFWKGFTPKWAKCYTWWGRVREEKTFIHFVLIVFILVENVYN